MQPEFRRRFAGIERLYGDSAARKIFSSHIVVVGVGGVGSWVVEALARSGVARLDLIDFDHVSESNINRQLCALESTLGRTKIEVLAERVSQIHAGCEVRLFDAMLDQANMSSLITLECDWVIDCIDSFRIKAQLIAECRERRQSILTVGGAGGQIDGTRVRVSDLRQTEQDKLLAQTRRLLRQEYRFPRNPKRSFGVPAVWSDEPVRQSQACSTQQDTSLNCAGFGSSMAVTASFGLAAAGHVLNLLARD